MLRIYPSNENTKIVNLKETYKSHLYMLMPVLSECITTKENDIKGALKDIFLCISQDMGIAKP